MNDRIQASLDVWLRSDVERFLRALIISNSGVLASNDATLALYRDGFIAATFAMGAFFGIDVNVKETIEVYKKKAGGV